MSPVSPLLRGQIQARTVLALAGQLIDCAADACNAVAWSLTFRSSNVRAALNVPADGRTAWVSDRADFGGVTLWFPRIKDLTGRLSGGRGVAIPIPTGVHLARPLRCFSTASATIAPTIAGDDLKAKTALLLRATAEGIATVARFDISIGAWASRIENGNIEIAINDAPEMGATITSRDGTFAVSYGSSEEEVPRARLIFHSVNVAHDVLTGTKRAISLIATGEVAIRGRLPMVQNLFPILDRLSDIMSQGAPA